MELAELFVLALFIAGAAFAVLLAGAGAGAGAAEEAGALLLAVVDAAVDLLLRLFFVVDAVVFVLAEVGLVVEFVEVLGVVEAVELVVEVEEALFAFLDLFFPVVVLVLVPVFELALVLWSCVLCA